MAHLFIVLFAVQCAAQFLPASLPPSRQPPRSEPPYYIIPAPDGTSDSACRHAHYGVNGIESTQVYVENIVDEQTGHKRLNMIITCRWRRSENTSLQGQAHPVWQQTQGKWRTPCPPGYVVYEVHLFDGYGEINTKAKCIQRPDETQQGYMDIIRAAGIEPGPELQSLCKDLGIAFTVATHRPQVRACLTTRVYQGFSDGQIISLPHPNPS